MKRIALIIIGVIIVAACSGQEVLKRNLELRKTTPVLNLNGTGATIQFYNGDISLTQSANQLSLSGGNLSLGSNSLLMTGSLGATGSRLTKGWFTNAEFTNLPTVGGATFKSALSLTASDVGLGNVTNESKATMFTSPTFTGTTTLATPFTLGSTSVTATGSEINALAGVTGSLAYSTENYGATGTGDIVLSTGPTLTTVNITDVIKLTPTASPPSGATEGMIYADTDHHLYYHNGTTWIQLDN